MANLPRIVLWVAAAALLGFGVAFLFAPLATLALTGVVIQGGEAAVEIRAFYGGLEIGLGLAVLWCALRRRRWKDGLGLTALVFGGAGLARLFGMAVESTVTFVFIVALLCELALAIAALLGLLQLARAPASGTEAGAG